METANKDTCPRELCICGRVFFISQKRRALSSSPLCFIYVTLLLSIISISGELLRGLDTGYRSFDNHKLVLKSKIERH